MYYVYFLISPTNNKIFYIGKGKGNRLKKHVMLAKKGKISNGNVYLYRKIRSILDKFDDVEYKIVFETYNELEAYEKEQELICEIGLHNLCNMSLGFNLMSEDIKSKISCSLKKLYQEGAYKAKLRETYDSEEYRKSQSIAIKNSSIHKEKMASDEVRKKISISLKEHYDMVYGNYKDIETKCCVCEKKIIVFEREFLLSDRYYCSSECRYHIRRSEEYRKNMSSSVKNSQKHKSIYTDEFRKNISDSAKKWWSSLSEEELVEYKTKMSESLKNSESHKKVINTQEYRNNLSDGIKNSEGFKQYTIRRKGQKRGPYKESPKNISRRKKSILIDENNNIVVEFNSLGDICEYFNIKMSTASVWLKNNKNINGMTLIKKED